MSHYQQIDIKNRINDFKSTLSNYGRVQCIREDLERTELDEELYSNNLYVYRSEMDKFVYIHDEVDQTDGKLTVGDLKVILESVAAREIQEKYELIELEIYLSSEDDE